LDNLPFSAERQLRRRYGAFYDLVTAGTSGIPKSVDPRIRSGARVIVGEAQQVRQKFPHHGSVPTEDLYIILCHGISGYTIKPEFINAPYPILNQQRQGMELPAEAGTPMEFRFTTGIDVDTVESVVILARPDSDTMCTLELLDSRPSPPNLMGTTQAKVNPKGTTALTFQRPIRLIDSHGSTPYILRFTFSGNVRVSAGGTARPDQRVLVGSKLYRDIELTGSIVGRLVDTRDHILMLAPVHNGFIYGRTEVINKLGITPPYTPEDVAAVGAFALTRPPQT